MTDDRGANDANPNEAPWWHSSSDERDVDSVLVEGMRLASALRDWAVESGAVAAVTDLTQTAAGSAAAYLGQLAESQEQAPDSGAVSDAQPVVRCADCPVCQGLDALDRSNPQLAQTARAGLSQLNTLISGLLGAPGAGGQANH